METPTKNERRPLWKKFRRWRNRMLVLLGKYTLPYIYLAYIRFVWWTSEVIDDMALVDQFRQEPPYKGVGVLWHQDVFCVPWAYREKRPHTLASVGDAGEIITHILELCHFSTIMRGGSSQGKKRHTQVLPALIEHMQTAQGMCGITVDGSHGPIYRLKRGAIVVAKECACPLLVIRIWCKRRILLPTWDRTMIPLPFNRIIISARGPYHLPADADNPDSFEKFRQYVEHRLLDLTYQTFLTIDKQAPPQLMALFPEDWQPPQAETRQS